MYQRVHANDGAERQTDREKRSGWKKILFIQNHSKEVEKGMKLLML